MVDMMANNQAMTAAVAGCSDELIVKNIAAKNQKDAWYNKAKKDKSSKDTPENVPAAYIGVSRTDSMRKTSGSTCLYREKTSA